MRRGKSPDCHSTKSVTGLGGSLGISMRAFDPTRIQCGEVASNPPFEDDCEELEQTIPAAASPLLIFGPPWGRGGTHSFPATYHTKRKAMNSSQAIIED